MFKSYTKIDRIKGSIAQIRAEDIALGELAQIKMKDGRTSLAEVISFNGKIVNLQVFAGTKGISTGDQVRFLGRPMVPVFRPRFHHVYCKPMKHLSNYRDSFQFWAKNHCSTN